MSETPRDPNDWIRYTNLNEQERTTVKRSCRGGPHWRITGAVIVIALGVFLFLGNIGILPSYSIWDLWQFWPLALVAAGIGRFFSDRTAGKLWGVFLVFLGAMLLSVDFGWIRIHTDSASWIVSLVLIGLGFMALIGVLEQREGRAPWGGAGPWMRAHFSRSASNYDLITDITVLGALRRKLDSVNFQGGSLTAILGNIDIDLRRASMDAANQTVVVAANSILGAIKIRVPVHWRVVVRGMSVLGNYEDKTVPPNTGASAPTLIVGGWSFMGAVEIVD